MSCLVCSGPPEVECPKCHTSFCYTHWIERRQLMESGQFKWLEEPPIVGCGTCGAEF